MKITWTDESIQSTIEIRDYIAKDNPVLAEEWVNKMMSSIEDQLMIFPESGRIVPEINDPNIRELIRGNYRAIYQFEKQNVSILKIVHSKRDFKPNMLH